MERFKYLHQQNTADKWPSPKEFEYCVANKNGFVGFYATKPCFNSGYWTLPSYTEDPLAVRKADIDEPIPKIALQLALEYGPEYAILKRPGQQYKTIWQPEYGEDYYIPDYLSGYEVLNCRNTCTDDEYIMSGMAFRFSKYADWVAWFRVEPMILQAALAVDGLATRTQYLSDRYLPTINISLFVGKADVYIRHQRVRDIGSVYFCRNKKAEEALKVRMPDGKTLEENLMRIHSEICD